MGIKVLIGESLIVVCGLVGTKHSQLSVLKIKNNGEWGQYLRRNFGSKYCYLGMTHKP